MWPERGNQKETRSKKVEEYLRAGGDIDLILENLGVECAMIDCHKIQKLILKEKLVKSRELRKSRAVAWLSETAVDWQSVVAKYVGHELADEERNDRSVIFIYGPNGNDGKSKLIEKLVEAHPKECVWIPGDKKANLAFHLKEFPELSVVLIDLTRDKCPYFQYSIVEELKRGVMFSPKYQSEMIDLKGPCTVIVFTNQEPRWLGLSRDRFVVGELVKKDNTLSGNEDSVENREILWWDSEKIAEKIANANLGLELQEYSNKRRLPQYGGDYEQSKKSRCT